MKNNTIYNLMNKRGQADVILGAVVLIGIILFGGAVSYKIISENRYVGDKSTLLYYDLKECDIKGIPRENLINFKSSEEAEKNGYNPAECNP